MFEDILLELGCHPLDDLGHKRITRLADKSILISLEDIRVSETYGKIDEVYVGLKSKELVIHIQDAHMNRDAMICHAYLIEEILARYGVNQVLKEGGTVDDLRLRDSRHCLSEEDRLSKAKKKFDDFSWDGIDWLYVVCTHYPLDIRGIEDRGLYKYLNHKCYVALDALRPEVRKYLTTLTKSIGKLKTDLFNRALNDLDEKREQYTKKNMPLGDYAQYLKKKSSRFGIDIRSRYPNIERFLETMRLEKLIDFPGVDRERERLMKSLRKKLKAQASQELDKKFAQFQSDDLNPVDFYTYLTSSNNIVPFKPYRNLIRYQAYLSTFDAINTRKLFSEIDDLNLDIKDNLFQNEDQRTIDIISRNCETLCEFAELSLTPDEYTYYLTHKQEMDFDSWLSFLKDKSKKGIKLKEPAPEYRSRVEQIIPLLEEYYDLCIQRAHVFVDRTLEHIKYSRSNAAILVAGGFHTPTITRLLRSKEVSHIVIAPNIENPTQPGLWDKIIRKQIKKDLKKEGG